MRTQLRRSQGYLLVVVLLASAGIGAAAASAGPKPRPLVKITKAPASRSHHPEAIFRFKTRPKTRTACRRDKQRYRKCRGKVKYSVRPGRHVFILRARRGKKTVYIKRRWTVLAPKRKRPAPPAISPIDAPTVARSPETGLAATRQLVFADEFNGTALNPVVWRPFDSAGHAGYGLRRPSALALDGQGNLVITAQNVDGQIVAGGMAARHDFTYGRVVFRVRTEPDPTGTMSAVVLTWPKQQWSPDYTENDMYETGPRVNNRSQFDSFIHFGPTTHWQKWTTHEFDPSQWHTIAMEWYPNLLEIYVDGQLGLSISDPYVIPDLLHHICIQLDARANRTLARPVRMFVDYVRVYQ